MPLDPSIVSNAFANISSNMPDVNALMQQRVRGAENIYQIETGRQEQAAQAAQEAAKAQEDAAFKALLPAYTYGIQTGDMAGALNLVPPEMQESLVPYVDALTGKSPQEVQAALIGSLSSSPAGQEALAAIQRGQTFGVQSRQQDLAEKKYAAELAAAGQPKPMSAFEEAQSGFRERELKLKEQEIAATRTAELEAPNIKQDAGRAKVDDTLSEMLRSYNILKQEGAIVSNEASGLENVIASTGAALGTTAGRALGTKAQTERDYIQSLRMNLISDIKAASNKSAQELNSNMELRAALDSLSDPYGQSFETALRTIAKLSRDYGKGEMAIIEPAPAGAGAAGAGAGDGTRRYDSTGKRIQ